MDKIIITIIGIGMYIASYFPDWHAPAIVGLFGLAMIAGYADNPNLKSSDSNDLSLGIGWALSWYVTIITIFYFATTSLAHTFKGPIIASLFFAAFLIGYPFVSNMVSGFSWLVSWFISKVEKMERKLESELY